MSTVDNKIIETHKEKEIKKTKAEEEKELRELQKTKLQLEIYILNWIYSFIKESVKFDGETIREVVKMIGTLKNTAPEDMETAIIGYLMSSVKNDESNLNVVD